jgi:PAS domain S-box-containing protein
VRKREKIVEVENLFAGGGEMGALMRSLDWSQTPLGSVSEWPQSLKTAVRIILTSRQPMFVWWGKELINLYNDAYKAILGGKHPQVLGQPAFSVWQEIWDRVGPRAESAMLKNEGTYDEALLLIMERNGYPEETYYTFSYSPIPNDRGEPGGIICANTDDTQRIIGERQLQLLRELAAKTADARTFQEACRLSASGLETNPYDLPFATIYLVDSEKGQVHLAGTSGIDRNHPAIRETVDLNTDSIWPFAEVIKTQQASLIHDFGEYQGIPTGAWQQQPHQAIAIPIAPSGQTGKSGVLIAGLNPFRLFDDNYKGFLELVAAQIAASIANAQAYEEERKRAEALAELDRAKTVFFSNVSHEFRTPLTLMLNPLEELSDSLGDRLHSDEREQFQLVQRNGLRLQKLVNTLLDFSRIEAGRIQALYEPTDLASFTAELASVFRSTIERAGMKLEIECATLPEPVYVDREMWEKIVLNLLSNAFKFTFAGTITVRLQAVGDCVELAVEDTGVGIPETELPRLFERFHRVSGTRSRTYEGSGIGLALVQELVKLHHGTIGVTSQLDRGTSFKIAIPFGSAHLPAERIQTSRTLPSTALGTATFIEEAFRWLPEQDIETSSLSASLSLPLPASSCSARILLADDNADMRDYIKRLLSSSYQVETVANGREALNAVLENPPDLVLTDVMMPQMDGFKLLRSLRGNPAIQDIPIILLSARAGEEARIEGLEAGADDYLIKPFSARELIARVEATLKLARLRQQAQEREQELRLEAEAAKEQIEAVLSSINDGFIVLERDWRYTYINNRQLDLIGKQRDEVIGKIIWEVFPEAIGTEVYDAFVQAMTQRMPISRETLYTPWNRWFEVRIYPCAIGISVFSTEITARKRIEAALRESEQRFRDLADNAPMMIWVTDPTGYCTYLNRSWYDFSGQTEQTGLGYGWLEITHPEDREYSKNIFLAANARREAFQIEYRLRRKDGEYRFCIDAGSPWFGVDGEFKGYIGSVIDISDRKGAEEALRQSEARLHTVAANLPHGAVFIVDRQLRYRLAEGKALEDVGMTSESFVGKTLWEALDPALATYYEPYYRQALSGEPFTIEHHSHNRYYVSHGTPMYNERGKIEAVLAMSYDISDRKGTEEKLRQSEARLRQAIAIETVGVIFFKTDGSIIDANDAFLGMSGYSREDLEQGRVRWDELTPPEWMPHSQKAVEEFKTLGHTTPYEKEYIRKNGSRWWALFAATRLNEEEGVEFVIDITDKKQTQEALRESESRFRLMVESAKDYAIFTLDLNGVVTSWNSGAERLLGYSEAEIIGCKGRIIFTPEDNERGRAEYEIQIALTQGRAENERWHLRKDGSRFWGSGLMMPLQSKAGTTQGFVKILQDKTTQKQTETEREQLLQLEQAARAEAENANRLKDEFLAVLSHELRSPLNPILGWSQLLRGGKLNATQTAQGLETIERNAKLQTQLIEDLLDIFRIVRGKLVLNISPVDLAIPITAAIETVQLAAQAKSIEIKRSVPARMTYISGDSSRLQQIVWNLLSNAVKFTSPQGQVEIRLERVGNEAQIGVKDTGKGIKQEFLPHVFDYFRQEDGKTTRQFGGLGLGLAIVRQLTELHGGTVAVDSPGEGQGATFTIRFPLLKDNSTQMKDETDNALLLASDASLLTGTRILVVDDEADMQDLAIAILAQAGASVMVAASAAEALLIFDSFKPDVLVSDIGMPDVDGYMLMQQVKSRLPSSDKQIPAIALTAYAGDFDRQQALQAGFQRHLAKPIEPDELVETIATLIGRNGDK